MASSSTKRPDAVRVGYMIFDVKYLSEKQWKAADLDDQDAGNCEGWKGLIRIRLQGDEQHETATRELLMHELLHACWYVAGLFATDLRKLDDVEEDIVRVTSPVMLQVLRDNPDLMAYLQG